VGRSGLANDDLLHHLRGVQGAHGAEVYGPRVATIRVVSWPWIVLLALAAALLVGAEWPRVSLRVGPDARRARERRRRKAQLKVVRGENDDFVASVQRDLERLPTIDENDRI